MFSAARLRLTLWYLAVLGTIVVLLSVALYDVLLRLQQAEAQALGRVMRHGVVQLFARDERALAWQIGAIDLGMLILAALGAYVLAGRTLRPIQEAMERQERFAAAASHELRTPLTVLQGTLEVALLRRDTLTRASVMRVGDLELDTLARRVRRAGQDVALSAREYALLEYLVHHAGQILTREQLAAHVWSDAEVESNVIDVYVRYLRQKVDVPFGAPLIHTVRGIGYTLRAP